MSTTIHFYLRSDAAGRWDSSPFPLPSSSCRSLVLLLIRPAVCDFISPRRNHRRHLALTVGVCRVAGPLIKKNPLRQSYLTSLTFKGRFTGIHMSQRGGIALISRLKFYHIQLTLCSDVTTRVCFDGTQKMFVRWKLKRWKVEFFCKAIIKKVKRDVIPKYGAKWYNKALRRLEIKFFLYLQKEKLEGLFFSFVNTRNECNKTKLYMLKRYRGLTSLCFRMSDILYLATWRWNAIKETRIEHALTSRSHSLPAFIIISIFSRYISSCPFISLFHTLLASSISYLKLVRLPFSRNFRQRRKVMKKNDNWKYRS